MQIYVKITDTSFSFSPIMTDKFLTYTLFTLYMKTGSSLLKYMSHFIVTFQFFRIVFGIYSVLSSSIISLLWANEPDLLFLCYCDQHPLCPHSLASGNHLWLFD